MRNASAVVVDVWTDVVCPWCYIGVTRFERALEAYGGPVEVRVHPFQLDPEAPIPGVPARLRYVNRFGTEADAILERVTREAASDGLDFRMDRAIVGNTFDAHRAIRFASKTGSERRLEMSLYAAYFTDGLDVSDRDVLAERAALVGIDRTAMAAHLESDDGVREIASAIEAAYERGITAVPSFVFEDEFLVPGAVDSATFLRIFSQMSAVR